MENIQDLQKELQDRIADLDKQRKEEAHKFANEVAQRNALAEAERSERIREYQTAEAERKAKKEAEEQERIRFYQEELKMRRKLESDLAAADEAKRLQQEKLEWLRNEIAKQEFIEEQHRKAMQSISLPKQAPVGSTEIDVENPTASDNNGEAVTGTDGSTPDSNVMSTHLKHILRQATRP